MKSSFRTKCVVLVLTTLTSFLGITREKPIASTSEGKPIVIRQEPPPQGSPRSPWNNPFFAELMGNYVVLEASVICGTVSVNVISTGGDNYSTDFDTSDVIILIPLSGSTGDYILTITLSDGTHYIGEFSI